MKKICKNCEYFTPRRKPMTCCYDVIGLCNKDSFELEIVSENCTCEKFNEAENDICNANK